MSFRFEGMRWRRDHWLLLIAPVAALLTGLVVGGVSPVIGVGLVVGILGAVVLFIRPDWAWVLTVLLATQAIPGTWVPELPLGVARAKVYEVTFFIGFLGAFFSSVGTKKDISFSNARWAARSAFLLIGAIAVSAAYGKLFMGNSEMVLAEARSYMAFIALYYVALLAVRPGVSSMFDASLTVSGVVLSTIVVVQLMTGAKILDARVEDLGLSSNTGITRSLTDVGTLVQAYAIYRLAQLSLGSRHSFVARSFLILALALAILGLLGTFTRGAWIAVAAGGIVAAYVAGGGRRVFQVLLGTFAFLLVLLIALYSIKPRVVEAIVDRALSVSNELESGASYGWRRLENAQAMASILHRPVFGVGLGGAYKNEVKRDAGFQNDQYFIHNGYLYFPLKMGVLGVLIGLWMLINMLRLIVRHSPGNSIHSAVAGVCVVFLITNISGPMMGKFFPILLLMSFVSLRNSELAPER